jgi:hypothetical protein
MIESDVLDRLQSITVRTGLSKSEQIRQGIRWWEVDATYYILRVLSWFRIARDLRPFPIAEASDESAA